MEAEIRALRVSDEASLRAAQADLAVDGFEFAFGLDDVDDFAEYVRLNEAYSRGQELEPDRVPHTFLVADDGGDIVGRVSIRHELNEWLAAYGGHLGYGVVSTHRRRGIATQLLAAGLAHLRDLGVERVLVTCDEGNVASATIIERAGGVLENILDDPTDGVAKRRYWIDNPATA